MQFPPKILDHPPEDNFTEQQQVASTDNNVFNEIPQLEEDWENGQFTDADTNLINGHNTHSESERIQKEYTEHTCTIQKNIPQISCNILPWTQNIMGLHQGDPTHKYATCRKDPLSRKQESKEKVTEL